MSYVLTINLVNKNYLTIASGNGIDRNDMELFMEDCHEDSKLEVRSFTPIPIDIFKTLTSRCNPSQQVIILNRRDVSSMNLSIL